MPQKKQDRNKGTSRLNRRYKWLKRLFLRRQYCSHLQQPIHKLKQKKQAQALNLKNLCTDW